MYINLKAKKNNISTGKQFLMKDIDVATGEVKKGSAGAIITAHALGSCLGVVAYNIRTGEGGIAHVMLPGCCRSGGRDNRYARDGIETLLEKLAPRGPNNENIRAALAGGGNVLRRPGDQIGPNNIRSVREELERRGIEIIGESVGGANRRKIRLDLSNGILYYFEGDNSPEILAVFRDSE